MAKVNSFSTDMGAIDISLPTATDLSALQYCYVKLHATTGKVVACGLNEKMAGILQNAPVGSASADAVAQIRVGGVSILKVAETIIPGNFLTSTAASLGEVCDAAGEEYGAVALSDGSANDYITVLIARGEVEATDA